MNDRSCCFKLEAHLLETTKEDRGLGVQINHWVMTTHHQEVAMKQQILCIRQGMSNEDREAPMSMHEAMVRPYQKWCVSV